MTYSCSARRSAAAVIAVLGMLVSVVVASSTPVAAAGTSLDFYRMTRVVPFAQGVDDVSCWGGSFCMAVERAGGTYALFDGSTWGPSTPVQDDLTRVFTFVSCGSTTFCMTIDSWGVAWSWNGSGWQEGVRVADTGQWADISCTGPSYCVAISFTRQTWVYNGAQWGRRGDTPDLGNSQLLHQLACAGTTFCVADEFGGTRVTVFDGSNWGAPKAITSTQLRSVTCASRIFCLALDANDDLSRFDGSSWSTPTPVVGFEGGAELSCVTSTFCLAVQRGTGKTLRYDGSGWTQLGTTAPVGAQGLFCGSTSRCVAVGQLNAVFDGVSWSSGAVGFLDRQLVSVSCPSSTFCMAVDAAGYVIRWDGQHWSTPLRVDAAANGPNLNIDCTSATFCLLVDGSGNYARYDGVSWSAPATLSFVGFYDVDCVTATFCVGTTAGLAPLRFDGIQWTAMSVHYGDSAMTGVSCTSTSFCLAVSPVGKAWRFDGQAWGASTVIDNHSILLSCASSSFCAAVEADGGGRWLRYDGQAWSSPALISSDPSIANHYLGPVSCTSSSFCLLGAGGRVASYDGTSWQPERALRTRDYIASTSLSCASSSFCAYLVDGDAHMTLAPSATAPVITATRVGQRSCVPTASAPGGTVPITFTVANTTAGTYLAKDNNDYHPFPPGGDRADSLGGVVDLTYTLNLTSYYLNYSRLYLTRADVWDPSGSVLVQVEQCPGTAPTPSPSSPPPTSTSEPPHMTAFPTALNVGSSSTVTIAGTPGAGVQLLAYSQPSTTYAVVRSGRFDTQGRISFTVAPRTNTRLFAHTTGGNSPSQVISVRPAESLRGSRSGQRASFTGQIVPGHGGAQVRVFTVTSGRLTQIGTATTDANGAWHLAATPVFRGQVQFISQTLSDATNLSGQSNRVTLNFG